MYLTREQERMLSGEHGDVVAKALELIVRVGDAVGAQKLVKICHAHVSGVSYSNIGKYGLEFILDFYRRGGRARVYTTINPGCLDYCGLSRVVENRYEYEQSQIDMALGGMGLRPVHTCIPYYYRPPLVGEHLAWGESSAVIFANTIYGAMTNREGGPVALAASITGYTYYAGLHIMENRKCSVEIRFDPSVLNKPISVIGLWIGDNVRKIPCIRPHRELDLYEYKLMLASMAATGSHAMAVIKGVTPAGSYTTEIEDRIYLENSMVEDYFGEEIPRDAKILGYIGCPHLHPQELLRLYKLIRKYGYIRRGRLLLTIPREFTHRYRDIIMELKARGVDIACGTCPVVSLINGQYDVVVTNSGKAAFYLKKIHGLKTRIENMERIVRIVSRGE